MILKKAGIFLKVLIITIVLGIFLLIADIFIVFFQGVKKDAIKTYPALNFLSAQLEQTTGEDGVRRYSMTPEGMEMLGRFDEFAFILDDSGDVVWSFRLPEDVPRHFTLGEVVSFTRYYLNDYPVFARVIDGGVLVVGAPRHTYWKYQLVYRESMVKILIDTSPALFVINAAVLLTVPYLIIRHDARRREKQRTEWIAGVSHDIRTPLSLVLGHVHEILHSATGDGNQPAGRGTDAEGGVADDSVMKTVIERAQMIEQQAMRIKMLVTNLNTENKLAYGMGVWHREKVLMPALIREVVCEIINRNLDEKYDISVIIPEKLEPLYITGDKELMKRLLENLMNNAISHNPQGCKIRVSLAWEKRFLFTRTVLDISDDGRGVSEKQLKSFQAFGRSDKLPEHGLGLRLVRQISSFHHWKVRFSNNKNGGFGTKIYF